MAGMENLGVQAIDDYTLQHHAVINPTPYFITQLAHLTVIPPFRNMWCEALGDDWVTTGQYSVERCLCFG